MYLLLLTQREETDAARCRARHGLVEQGHRGEADDIEQGLDGRQNKDDREEVDDAGNGRGDDGENCESAAVLSSDLPIARGTSRTGSRTSSQSDATMPYPVSVYAACRRPTNHAQGSGQPENDASNWSHISGLCRCWR